MAGWPLNRNSVCGGSSVSAADGGDVAQSEEAIVDAQVEAAQALLRRELSGHPDADAFGAGLDHAGRRDRILGLERLHDVLLADAEGGHLARRELQEDHLVLRADQLDLADIRHRENLGPHVLDIVAQLPLRQPVRGERVDVAEHVAEIVVEERDPRRPAGNSLLTSLIMFRTLTQTPGTSRLLVVSFRLT